MPAGIHASIWSVDQATGSPTRYCRHEQIIARWKEGRRRRDKSLGEITMKALVIYDSAYGNTARIAQAIGSALGSQEEVAVGQVDKLLPEKHL
jgi:hypothetical protein